MIKGSILDDEKLKWAFKEKPKIVYHLAAHFANQNSVDNPETDLMVNGMGTLKVLEHAHLVGVERFIYASSGCGIYGADSKMPFEEHDVSMKLYTPYQVTKMLGELYTNCFIISIVFQSSMRGFLTLMVLEKFRENIEMLFLTSSIGQ